MVVGFIGLDISIVNSLPFYKNNQAYVRYVPFRPIRHVDLNDSYLEAGIQFSSTNLRSVPTRDAHKKATLMRWLQV